MQLGDSPADAAFRAEIRDWMSDHLTGEFAQLRFRGGPGDEHMFVEERMAWERHLAAHRWTCVGWPAEHGGRGLPISQEVIFHEEYARAGGPGRAGLIGEGLLGPTLIHFASPEQQRQFLGLLGQLNAEQLARHPGDKELEAVVQSYELAWRMQQQEVSVRQQAVDQSEGSGEVHPVVVVAEPMWACAAKDAGEPDAERQQEEDEIAGSIEARHAQTQKTATAAATAKIRGERPPRCRCP